jgi:hypothetical protein
MLLDVYCRIYYDGFAKLREQGFRKENKADNASSKIKKENESLKGGLNSITSPGSGDPKAKNICYHILD